MRTRAGMIAAAVVALALTGCSAAAGSAPGALAPAPTVTVTVEAPVPPPTPSVAPMPAGITEAEELYLSDVRFFDSVTSDDELLRQGWSICEVLRAGERVEESLSNLEYPATQALCRDVL